MIRRLLLFSLVALSMDLAALPPRPVKPASVTTQAQKADRWTQFRFLIGNWSGDGVGPAGKGLGNMTVETDLDNAILRMTNQVEFASQDKKTLYRGTMVVSSEQKALFLDNEGHVLHYTVTATPRTITFVSVREPVPVLPRFRFIYNDLGGGKVRCSFDVAPPDTPNKFTIHVTGIVTKR